MILQNRIQQMTKTSQTLEGQRMSFTLLGSNTKHDATKSSPKTHL